MLKCYEALLNISRDIKSHNALSLWYQQWNAKLDIRVWCVSLETKTESRCTHILKESRCPVLLAATTMIYWWMPATKPTYVYWFTQNWWVYIVFSSNVVRNVKHIIKRMDHICFPKWKVSGQGDNRNMQEIILWTILISKLWDYFNQTRHSCCIWYAHIYLNDYQGYDKYEIISRMPFALIVSEIHLLIGKAFF